MELYLHDVDLGRRVSLEAGLKDQLGTEAVRAILQMLRDKKEAMERTGRVTPLPGPGAPLPDPLEYRAFHAGAANVLEEVFFEIWKAGEREE